MKKSKDNQILDITLRDYKWIIFVLVCVIIAIVTYKFWDIGEPIETLISVGGSLISIVLGLVAIFYAFAENVKATLREKNVSNILSEVEKNVSGISSIVDEVKYLVRNTHDDLSTIKDKILRTKEADYVEETKNINNDSSSDVLKEKASSSDLVSQVEITAKANIQNLNVRNRVLRKGDVCIADLDEVNLPNIVKGVRPILVIQSEVISTNSPTVIVVPLSSRITYIIPTNIIFDFDNKKYVAIPHQMRVIEKNKIEKYLGTVYDQQLEELNKVLKVILEL